MHSMHAWLLTPSLLLPDRSIPDRARVRQHGLSTAGLGVTVEKDLRFGPGERLVSDVYAPADAALADSSSAGKAYPVICFVHGGVWASGEKW